MRRFALVVLLLAAAVPAKNVDLVTLPDRASVQLTIYNSEDLTLVRETRAVTFKRGRNELQFSWANTLIDPTSVEFRPLEHADAIEVRDTVYPGAKPQHLIWSIDSQYEGQAMVEVSYFTSGLTWSMDYVALCDPAEDALSFRGFVRVHNNSGEEYENAQVRLIVGTINLVEKIADLARQRGLPMPQPGTATFGALRDESASRSFAVAEAADKLEGKEIVKEGLSEYFMFSVSGTETIRHGWSKRMQAVDAAGVKFETVYRLRPHQYGPRPVRFFVWKNDAEHGLGESPLPDGRVRVLRENPDGDLSLLGADMVRYVPVQAPLEVNLGADDRVGCDTRRLSTRRFDFRFHHNPPRVAGWTEEVKWEELVWNRRDRPIVFEIRRIHEGDVSYLSEMETRLFDYRTIEARFTVPARADLPYPATVRTQHGTSQLQQRIEMR